MQQEFKSGSKPEIFKAETIKKEWETYHRDFEKMKEELKSFYQNGELKMKESELSVITKEFRMMEKWIEESMKKPILRFKLLFRAS